MARAASEGREGLRTRTLPDTGLRLDQLPDPQRGAAAPGRLGHHGERRGPAADSSAWGLSLLRILVRKLVRVAQQDFPLSVLAAVHLVQRSVRA